MRPDLEKDYRYNIWIDTDYWVEMVLDSYIGSPKSKKVFL